MTSAERTAKQDAPLNVRLLKEGGLSFVPSPPDDVSFPASAGREAGYGSLEVEPLRTDSHGKLSCARPPWAAHGRLGAIGSQGLGG